MMVISWLVRLWVALAWLAMVVVARLLVLFLWPLVRETPRHQRARAARPRDAWAPATGSAAWTFALDQRDPGDETDLVPEGLGIAPRRRRVPLPPRSGRTPFAELRPEEQALWLDVLKAHR